MSPETKPYPGKPKQNQSPSSNLQANVQELQDIRPNRLMTVVVQEQDVDSAVRALSKQKLSVTRLPSTGGFLGRRSTTLLIGLSTGQEELVVSILHKNCRTRIEYVTIPLEGSPLPLPAPTPITVGGATIFVFEIERYEEI
jgi:uncharacterized protein YaaQ